MTAQTGPASQIQAFGITGPGRFDDDHAWYAGGGFEFVGGSGVGLGVEGAVAWGFQPDEAGGRNRATQLTTVYASATRTDSVARLQPFALAGVGFASPAIADTSLAFVLGAGTNLWLGAGRGLRLEVRLPIGLASSGGAVFHAGITLR